MLKQLVVRILNAEIVFKQELLEAIKDADLRNIAKAKASAVRQLSNELNELCEVKLSVDLATNEELRSFIKDHMED